MVMQNDAADATITCDGTYDGVREEVGYEDAPVSLNWFHNEVRTNEIVNTVFFFQHPVPTTPHIGE